MVLSGVSATTTSRSRKRMRKTANLREKDCARDWPGMEFCEACGMDTPVGPTGEVSTISENYPTSGVAVAHCCGAEITVGRWRRRRKHVHGRCADKKGHQ